MTGDAMHMPMPMTLAFDFAANPWAGLMIAGGAVMIMLLVMSNVRRKMAKQAREHVDPREKIEQTRQANGMRNDLRQMMVELEDLTRRFGSQLDAKSATLERLLEEAEAKAAELRALVDGAIADRAEGATEPTIATPRAAKPTGKPSRVRKGIELPAKAEPSEIDPMTQRIYELSDEGCGPVDIARQLGEHVGKVELILALRQQRV